MRLRQTMTCVLTVAALSLTSGCSSLVQVTRDVSMTADWQAYERIVVHGRNGRVELSSAEVDEIRVTGRAKAGGATLADAEDRLDQVQVTAEPDPTDARTFVITLEYPDDLTQGSVGADLTILVPEPCAGSIETSNGSVRAAKLRGPVVLRTSNGGVHVSDVDGNVVIQTGNAPIVVAHVHGEVQAVTSNGSVIAKSIQGDCELSTSNGGIEVDDVAGNVAADTSNGSIRLNASPPVEGSVVMTTSNGSIRAVLPATLKGELDLHTSNATLRTDLEAVPLRLKDHSRSTLRATMNGGGAGRIVAHSSNGSVTLQCR